MIEVVAAILLPLVVLFPAHAGFERYDYDSMGRLIRVIDERGRVTEYGYDGAGNILRVVTGDEAAAAPVVSSVSPTSIRRGETKPVTISGANLTGVAASVSAAGLDIFDVQVVSPAQVALQLVASGSAMLGQQGIQLSSAAGAAVATIAVEPALPKLYVAPTPLAIPPDNVARQVTLRLSGADTMDHAVGLTASNANIAVSPAQVTFIAGQTTAPAFVTGKTAGQANIQLSSATLGNTAVPVFVTAEFKGINTSHAKQLGVVVEANATPASRTVSPMAGGLVGVVVGKHVNGVSPESFRIGATELPLTISGVGLETASSVSIVPPDGVTSGTLAIAADGKSLTLPLSVAANASIGTRQVVVKDSAGNRFPVASASGDRISIVRQAPELDSISPLFSTRGTAVALTLRGRNLQGVQAVSRPTSGISFANDPVVNSDGTEAQIRMGIALDAAVGEYVVVVKTPGGSSSATASGANTFRVVSEIQDVVTPVTAATVGVILEGAVNPSGGGMSIGSRLLGVTVGGVVSGVSPGTGIVGTTATLTVKGSELNGVTALQFNPPTGLSVGPLAVAGDGKSVIAELAVAEDAPQTVRALRVLAGAAEIPFASSANSQFRVILPQPEMDSITPIALQKGQAPQTLLIRGRNLKNATQVNVRPPDGMAVSAPTVNADGSEISVSVGAASDAVAGPRVVTVVTPAGESALEASPTNTLTIADSIGPVQSPIASPPLGVVLDPGVPQSVPIGPIASASLGVTLESDIASAPILQGVNAPTLGVAVGPVANGRSPGGFAPGTTALLTITGTGLGQVGTVEVSPSQGVTLGAFSVSGDGGSLTVPLIIAADAAALVPRRIVLGGSQGEIPFAQNASPIIVVGPGIPRLDSIAPILATQGNRLTMTIRGANLAGATAVTATPGAGLAFANDHAVDAAGTELTVNFAVSPDAQLSPRTIRVWVPGAASTDEASPANTFTVHSP